MRALIVTNMYPSRRRPALGSFVYDQVQALRRTGEVDVDVFAFDPGGYRSYVRAGARLRASHGGRRVDVVHAHFGLSQWPALAAPARARLVTLHGTDLTDRRSRAITLAGLRLNDVVGVVSEPLAARVPGWASGGAGRVRVLPCGVDLERFAPLPRAEARARLGLDPDRPYVLFPADPGRPEKRHDRALAVLAPAGGSGAQLLTLGNVAPAQVPLWVNAANAVLVPSERESFGLAVLEALACEVPVLATPVGIAPDLLHGGLPGTLCAPFDAERWRAALAPALAAGDPRVAGGRERARPYSSDHMARRVLDAWRALLTGA